jgi:hypothetical protein
MAYLRIKRVKRGRYYYIMRSERKDGKVFSRVLEYLGRDPDPKRLKRALVYWDVVKPRGRQGR